MKILIQLFLSYFKIGAFSFGGGYAMIPLIQKEMIQTYGWMTNAEFVDIIAISEMTPGPIAINTATFLGYKVSGILGATVATIAVTLPSFIVLSLIFYFVSKFKNSLYIDWIFSGLRPVVLGLIGAAAINVGKGAFIDIKSVIIGVGLFYVITFKKFNPILGIVLAGVAGALLY